MGWLVPLSTPGVAMSVKNLALASVVVASVVAGCASPSPRTAGTRGRGSPSALRSRLCRQRGVGDCLGGRSQHPRGARARPQGDGIRGQPETSRRQRRAPTAPPWYVTLIGANRVLKFDRSNRLVDSAVVEVPGLMALGADGTLYVGRSMNAVNPPQRIAPDRTGNHGPRGDRGLHPPASRHGHGSQRALGVHG